MLRDYQEFCINKMMWAMKLPGNDIVSIAQGGGKSHIIAEFANKLGKPVLILVPNKELLEQDLDKLSRVINPSDIGIYSASMNSKEVKKYTLATIQSAYKHPEQFAHYEVVIIDEGDLLNPKNLNGMYNTFFKTIGNPKIFAMTGTPYRQDVFYESFGKQKWMKNAVTTLKMINRYYPFFWDRMLYVINTEDLMRDGYLSPLIYHELELVNHEHIPTNKSKSEFDLEKLDKMMGDQYPDIAKFIEKLPHKSCIVYCSTISQAETLQSFVRSSLVVTSTTSKKDRETAVKRLKAGKLRVLFNVGIYTVGFDYPSLESIVILRPTRSLRLHAQILGRVARKAEGKDYGYVYDFVSNIKNMGTLESIRVVKNPINGKWNVVSSARPNGFHMQKLFSYRLRSSNNDKN